MLCQVPGQHYQHMHLWRGYEQLPAPRRIHWVREGCSVFLFFARRNVVLSSLTPLSWDPLGFIWFVLCNTVCFCALFTVSQLFSFIILFATARTGFTRAMQVCTPVGTAVLISVIWCKICDLQYHPASAIFQTNFIPGRS